MIREAVLLTPKIVLSMRKRVPMYTDFLLLAWAAKKAVGVIYVILALPLAGLGEPVHFKRFPTDNISLRVVTEPRDAIVRAL